MKVRITGAVVSIAMIFMPLIASAADVSVPAGEEVSIYLSGLGLTYAVQSGSSATSIAVTETTFTITTSSTGSVSVSSATGKTMENDSSLHASCYGGGVSTISIGPDKTVIFSPSGGVLCVDIPSSGGGSGGMISTQQTQQTQQNTQTVQPEVAKFKDVTKANEGIIMPLVDLMLAKKTYEMPLNKIYGVSSIATGAFVIQAVLAVAGRNCGSVTTFPGARSCRAAAISAGLITSTFPIGNVTRVKYYEALLKAKNIPLKTNVTVAGLKKICIDAQGATLQMAKVYMTAKQAGIAGVYPGKKCRLSMAFSKTEAAKFAMRALSAK